MFRSVGTTDWCAAATVAPQSFIAVLDLVTERDNNKNYNAVVCNAWNYNKATNEQVTISHY